MKSGAPAANCHADSCMHAADRALTIVGGPESRFLHLLVLPGFLVRVSIFLLIILILISLHWIGLACSPIPFLIIFIIHHSSVTAWRMCICAFSPLPRPIIYDVMSLVSYLTRSLHYTAAYSTVQHTDSGTRAGLSAPLPTDLGYCFAGCNCDCRLRRIDLRRLRVHSFGRSISDQHCAPRFCSFAWSGAFGL